MPVGLRAVLCLVLLGAPACSGAGRAPVQDSPADSVAIATLVRHRLDRAIAGDTAEWHRQVADDAVWTGPGLAIATTRDVLLSIAANAHIPTGAQRIDGLAVHLQGGIAQATYVQFVANADSGLPGKRFRKTDTYRRGPAGWILVAATEIAIAERPRVSVATERLRPLTGTYVLGAKDSLTVILGGPGQLVIVGGGATPDTLVAESDSSFYSEGDRGSWIFARGPGMGVGRLIYRASGQPDVVLDRVTGP